MKFAIIAAGEGSRLANEGIAAPKPLIEVKGEKLTDRLIRIFMDNGASEIYVICNDQTSLVSQHLAAIQRDGLGGRRVPLRFIVKSTPSSMHSFYELGKALLFGEYSSESGAYNEPFCMTTVDTIFNEKEFAAYIAELQSSVKNGITDGLMGVTDYVDDEKPLYIGVDNNMRINGFFDEKREAESGEQDVTYISGGIYGLTPSAFGTLERCISRGESRMRNFQRALVADGLRLKAYPFSKVLDIDHASDIEKAEKFLQSEVTN